MQRTDQVWLDELQGKHGNARLEAAHRDLARYLYAVAYQQLSSRQSSTALLNSFDVSEIGELAADFVQQTLEKLVVNQCAVLQSYEGRGTFTGFVATIIINEVRQELRRRPWHQTVLMDAEAHDSGTGEDESRMSARAQAAYTAPAYDEPESVVLREITFEALGNAMQQCIAALNEMRRAVFWKVECEEQAVQDVALVLGLTPNAASLHLLRARRSLRKCLEQKGMTAEILELFAR